MSTSCRDMEETHENGVTVSDGPSLHLKHHLQLKIKERYWVE